MNPPAPRPGLLVRIEAWSAVRRVGVLTAFAGATCLVAFLWPAALGGCTALDVVPAGAAGHGLVAGDLVVTRCGPPGVGDRVVHRESGSAWSVGLVTTSDADGWWVRGGDGVGRAVPAEPDVLDPLPVHVARPVAVVVAGGAVAVTGLLAAAAVRRRAAARPA
ncbi:hypothetical protein Cfla_0683 [Cellulomonas flavigena DSM 20109]|uniref:Uncharacterized protein n=1 Tax=Cellulomonas flavigena (strain ATCC 482 / DSM 20109 / BCRC 11376 / JCM 18109 / NBRC 3775 / NCIMB 8073 / NRS 134) TaxID=446466 RepID=D5UJ72_CELFN|nr:hypothetical protein [Cellulomonas flavigena]ADG73595.1 hypothetical protein Cfla_0683 [Cellulomonas flavigena DSM 20109]